MDLSIVIPAYNEEENIELLYRKIRKVLDAMNKSYEIIFIDDGSTDKTLNVMKTLKKKDAFIKIIQQKSNVGKADALSKGFDLAKGNYVFTMDADLQDDPKEIPKFLKEINKGYDLVSGWKFKRHDPLSKRLPSKFFNWLTSKLVGADLHDFNCGFKCYKKEVVKNIEIYGELHRYIPALAYWKGYKIGEIKVTHHARKFGKSKYGVERLMKGFLDLVTINFLNKFRERPSHFFGPIGALLALLGVIVGIYLVVLWFQGHGIGQRPLLILAVLLVILGIQLFSIGLIGELVVSSKKRRLKVKNLFHNLNTKLKTFDEIREVCDKHKKEGKTIVTFNGSFDIVHPGHVYSIQESKKQGDILVMGLNSDESYRKYKKDIGAVNNEISRAILLSSFSDVDYVVIFDETTPIEFIRAVNPDVHCNGAEYGENCVEADVLKEIGAKLFLIPRIKDEETDFSTTRIIKNVKERSN